VSILLLDVGNSRLKWALAEQDVPGAAAALEHGGDPSSAVAAIDAAGFDAIWVANVTGPAHTVSLGAALQLRFGLVPHFARVEARQAGLAVAYADPQRLGVDRWLGLLAAWSDARAPLCVLGAGTALTFDAVDAAGRHLGGVIAPGLLTMQQAVLGATRFHAAGPDLDYSDGLGQDTEACVRQGALHACAGLAERLAARYAAGAARILTGGDAGRLMPHLGPGWTLRPELVMEGLLRLARGAAGSAAA